MEDMVRRIAEALERLATSPPTAPPCDLPGYRWDGRVLAVARFEPMPLDLLTGIDAAKALLVENCRRHAAGHAAHDVLLWGARGSGKSALVKAAVAATPGLALVALPASDIATLPALFATLADWDRRFIVFIDDLGFDDAQAARALRSVLDGGAAPHRDTVRLCVTANRRHIVARDMAEQASAIAPRDAADDALALADRFGLSLGFHVADQPTYLAMVARYAAAYDLAFDPDAAIRFATQRGSRSGRIAWHHIVDLAGRAGRSLG